MSFLIYVNMQKRGDGKVYADMHKTDERIYFTPEEAQAAIDAGFSPNTAHVKASVMMRDERIQKRIAELMEERATPRGKLRVSLPLSYGLKRLAPLMLAFSQTYPEIQLAMDFTDRRINLIEEGVDLSVRITGRLEPGDIVRKLGTSRLLALASPGYLALRGRPQIGRAHV